MNMIIIPKGMTSLEDTPSHYDCVRNGKRIRISAYDLPGHGSDVTEELRKAIEDHLTVFNSPVPEPEIKFQIVK